MFTVDTTMTARHLNLSGWFNTADEAWKHDAACVEHPQLPWTGDVQPIPEFHREMQLICEECPVLLRCAKHALGSKRAHGADGGFYAGVWLPWIAPQASRSTREMRNHSRAVLRRMLRLSEQWPNRRSDIRWSPGNQLR